MIGERGGSLFVEPVLPAGALVVTEGRALLGRRPCRGQPRGRHLRTGVATKWQAHDRDPPLLANPIAVLMVCIGLVVFAAVVTPRMSVDTFPELTPPVLVVGTLAPGLGPKDVEKTLTWRIEKYVSATPGVDHVESVSRNEPQHRLRLAQVGHRPQRRADAGAAAGRVRDVGRAEVARRPAAVRPPVRSVERAGHPGRRLGRRSLRPAALRLRAQQHRAGPRRHPRRRERVAQRRPPAADQRRRRSGQGAGARRHVERRRRGGPQSNALLPSGEFISPASTPTSTRTPSRARVATIGDAIVKLRDGKPVLIRDVARVEDGGFAGDAGRRRQRQNAVYLNVLRVPGGNTLEIVDAVKGAIGKIASLPPRVCR